MGENGGFYPNENANACLIRRQQYEQIFAYQSRNCWGRRVDGEKKNFVCVTIIL